MSLYLLSRAYCHLCDDMLAALTLLVEGRDVEVAVIDVDAHPELEARYGEFVPVLLAGDPREGDAVELCHYRLDTARVRDAIARPGA